MQFLLIFALLSCNVLKIESAPQMGSLFGGYNGYENPAQYPINTGLFSAFLNPWLNNGILPNAMGQNELFRSFNRGFVQPAINTTGEFFNILAGENRFANNQQTTTVSTATSAQPVPAVLPFVMPLAPQAVVQPIAQPSAPPTSSPIAVQPSAQSQPH